MPTVQRTFSLSEDIAQELDHSVKSQERSKFVTRSIARSLRDRSRNDLIDAIDQAKSCEPQKQSVVDTLRAIRSAHFAKLSTS